MKTNGLHCRSHDALCDYKNYENLIEIESGTYFEPVSVLFLQCTLPLLKNVQHICD